MRKRYVSMLMCFLLCFALFALPAAAVDENRSVTYGEKVTLSHSEKVYLSSSPDASLSWYQVSDESEQELSKDDGVAISKDIDGVEGLVKSTCELTGLDAGTYEYRVKLDGDTKNTFQVTVAPKQLERTAQSEPTAKAPSYTGEAQELVEAGVPTSQSGAYGQTVVTRIEYALGSNDTTAPTEGWSTAVPTAANAGSYHVWWRVAPVSVTQTTEEEDGGAAATRSVAASGSASNYAASDPTCIPVTAGAASIADAEIELGDALTYTGQQQTQTLTSVTLNGRTLVEGTDYEVSGNTGTDAKSYTLTITGKGDNYTGTATKPWSIAPAEIDADITVGKMTYTGQPQAPTVTVTATTVDGCPYTVTYSTDGVNYSDTLPTFTDVGSHTLYVKISAGGHDELVKEIAVEMSAPTSTSASTAAPATTAKPQAPNTGDEANVALWLALATVSVMGAALVARKKKAK